jgi:hypothetical protein
MKRLSALVLCLAGLSPVQAGDARKYEETVKQHHKPALTADAVVQIKPVQRWEGMLKDESLRAVLRDDLVLLVPGILTQQEQLKLLWKKWRGDEKVPDVDLVKNLVVVVTSRRSSRTRVEALVELDAKGDLKVSTRTKAEDKADSRFGYQIVVVSRQGVKTVGGKRVDCGRYNCGCHEGSRFDPQLIETEALNRKLQGVCWGQLAQYECFKNDLAEHKRMLSAAFADAAKSKKVVLYVANTGG